MQQPKRVFFRYLASSNGLCSWDDLRGDEGINVATVYALCAYQVLTRITGCLKEIELRDAQINQARLRDRLATSDLRLSVFLDAADSAGGCAVPAATGAGGVVHGGTRARLDPAHAQRIIGITDDGDQGLIALAACQAYVREVSNN